jgi:hypothetical protein
LVKFLSRLFLKSFGFIAVIFMAVPASFFAVLGREALLPVLLYFQLLVLWGQIEVSLRQHELFAAQYEPAFSVEFQWSAGENPRGQILLTNTSQNTAYNVGVGRVLGEGGKPIPPPEWKEKINTYFIPSLAANESKPLCSFERGFLEKKAIEVSYLNRFGEWGTVIITFHGGGAMFIPGGMRRRGFLLELFSTAVTAYRIWKWERSRIPEK